MAYNRVIIEQNNNRSFGFTNEGSYAATNQTEAEDFVISPSDFLVMRSSANHMRVFNKAYIGQIRFTGEEADIDSTYSRLVGS